MKHLKRNLLFTFALLAALAVYGFLNAGRFLAAPAGLPAKADAIVVLGGDGGARGERGLALYRQGYASRILLTGMQEGERGAQAYYLNWRAQMLLSNGVKKSRIFFDDSTDSWQEAGNTLALMKKQGWKSAIVVSDPPQMRRLHWTWGRRFKGSGLRFFLVASWPAWWGQGRWWKNSIAAKNVISEYIKLIYYVLAH
ncbi:MAG: YdcF family protein [Actinomycetota bacterium]|nr:YdcF family protein [Actinomycetota bacterium]